MSTAAKKSLSQLLGHPAWMLDDATIESLALNGDAELGNAARRYLIKERECENRVKAMLADPEWQKRAAERRAERAAIEVHVRTCDRCASQCEERDDCDGVLYDWCATCKRHLCGKCFSEGCCGRVPAKSGLEAM